MTQNVRVNDLLERVNAIARQLDQVGGSYATSEMAYELRNTVLHLHTAIEEYALEQWTFSEQELASSQEQEH